MSENISLIAAVRRAAMFSALKPSVLGGLLDRCRTRRYNAGQVIFTADAPAEAFFVILTGQVKVYKLSPRGEEQILHLYGPGETFGEAAALSLGTYPACAEALEPSDLLVVQRPVLRDAIGRDPDLCLGIIAGLSGKLQEFAELIEQLSLRQVPARLAKVLLDEAQRAGSKTFRLRQSKRQLAARIGTAAETLSRTLGRLKADGLIDVAGSQITLRDVEGLEGLCRNGKTD